MCFMWQCRHGKLISRLRTVLNGLTHVGLVHSLLSGLWSSYWHNKQWLALHWTKSAFWHLPWLQGASLTCFGDLVNRRIVGYRPAALVYMTWETLLLWSTYRRAALCNWILSHSEQPNGPMPAKIADGQWNTGSSVMQRASEREMLILFRVVNATCKTTARDTVYWVASAQERGIEF